MHRVGSESVIIVLECRRPDGAKGDWHFVRRIQQRVACISVFKFHLLLVRLIGRDSSPTSIHCCLYTRDCNLTQYAISPTFNHVPLNPSSDISVINEIFPLFTYPACFFVSVPAAVRNYKTDIVM